ncbi:MAG: DUF2975 domain-containing protein [Candidatus Microthrix sp.]|jgi:hypothetical protein|uniref:DUF2975 domain-containing protein n=1 Tax=Candidatus Neomicrothrix subdominans TaxID=2954438 RepID=A0A936TDF9_9ACTN|nr:DUF2975 domain-containing protein [Candidatus Microthrix sp.]MBK6437620.1 DUF2975 domain-containing protein [Candidatus Microthrix sp.]MBK7166082.1 DUF2975 domain-containing protein [Candidatus Microthrix sp.]MBK9297536.1 DUF2975 domain-containing protein [Candidatus Microthrix subdominans]MBP7594810.1 DUF2975 domain-containing protein [Candidatus Microthrix sp.]
MTTNAKSDNDSFLVIKLFESLLIVGMLFGVLSVAGVLIDKPALGLYGDSSPFVDAEPTFPVEFGDNQATIVSDNEQINPAYSQAPVEIGKPVTARFTFIEPRPDQRVIWVIWQVSGPLLVLAGLWLVYSVVRSARLGDPFVARNERRLWTLAGLIAVGGTGYSMLTGVAEMLMLRRSAAAGLTEMVFTVSFLPLVAGLGVAVLAWVWHVGISLQDEVAGTI